MQILDYKTVPGISLFHNCGGGNFSGGTADQFDPPRRARLNLISENYFIYVFYIANSLKTQQKRYPDRPGKPRLKSEKFQDIRPK